jgi:acetoacetate decarboxylase
MSRIAVIRGLAGPLEPDGNHVIFEWMKMLDSSGFGYQESGINIATVERHTLQLQLDDVPRR